MQILQITWGSATKQYVDTAVGDIDIPAAPETSPSPPSDPVTGQLWWNTNDGRLYIYYTDIDSSQWVPATPETENTIEVGADGGIENTPNGIQDQDPSWLRLSYVKPWPADWR